MFGRHRSTEVVCPHCGSTQLEPRGVISTYCRTCSAHFSPKTHPAAAVIQAPTFAARDSGKKSLREKRVACHSCGHQQRAHHGALEAPCRHCGSLIQYRDIEISTHSTREISTHGKIIVTRKGFLNSTRIQCASAHVEGRISGKINCSGLLRLAGSDQCKAQIHTASLLVDRGARLKLAYTTYIGDGIIRGRVEGDIVCTGTLRITKHGILLGELETRALTVDRGGIYSGDVRVEPKPNIESPANSENTAPHSEALWLPGFAFGGT